jgi:hypothetical protein
MPAWNPPKNIPNMRASRLPNPGMIIPQDRETARQSIASPMAVSSIRETSMPVEKSISYINIIDILSKYGILLLYNFSMYASRVKTPIRRFIRWQNTRSPGCLATE